MELAKQLPDRAKQTEVIAGILTFTDKVIDRAYANKLKEEMQMTLVGQMLINEGLEKGIRIFIQDNISENIPKPRIIEKLKKNFSLNDEDAIKYYTAFSGNAKD